MCRICLEEGGHHFCSCTGSCALVHTECLQKWVDISHRDTCEICLSKYTFPQHFQCRFRLRLSDVRLSKTTNISVLCCSFGFVLFIINFFFSLVLESFLVNMIASNIVTILVVSFSMPFTNTMQLYMYLSLMTSMSNILITNKMYKRHNSELYLFYLQCLLTATLFSIWAGKIFWRDSWVISGINMR